MVTFPKFWFEGNNYFDDVTNLEDLKRLFTQYDGCETIDGLLDKACNCTFSEGDMYGFARCHGDKTLRQFLEEKGITMPVCGDKSIDEYIKLLSSQTK